ncbi:hypothetical protein [Pararhizobium antarcticum]|uniref:Uncharacterized protein n=1 Tax=Pararhizobium antarcticum TaxID=1798805 RepID=A0A657LUI3_9HYPH|nr:hypothetical protein [Pararhizobium antarcticum]OJF97549.1 hypothetical protein AX761_14520 [Rhizobium sp. 58]OJF98779.1 hypothetical protein AX760_01750 [Pararhizobium antarcticum]OJF98834.1 hypothetical protein AX760_02065 [Pararhizobium antarcticum]
MWDFEICRTIGILLRTMPFILMRMAIYFGITIAFILSTGTGAGIGYGLGAWSNDAESFTVWGGIFGFGLVAGAIYWVREWLLYMVKAAHIAVMVKLIDGQPMPDGKSQITHGRETVAARFGETNVLFALDQLIKGVISVATGLIGGIAAFLPIPGLDTLARFANTVIRISLTYVDEIILGYNIRIDSRNPWESSRQGLVLYAQNGKTMIRNAVWLSIFLYLLAIIVFVLALAPAAAILYVFPGEWAGYAFVLAIVFAWSFKAAVLEPFAIAALMSVYFKVIEGQVPNAEWDAKLSSASEKFREIKDKAFGGTPAAA